MSFVLTQQYAKIWDGPGDSKKNIKLKVQFIYPSEISDLAAAPTAPATGEEVTGGEAVRKALARVPETQPFSSTTEDNTVPASATTSSGGGGGNSSADADLQALRKKYDAVVEYTVRLTVERDNIIAQLDIAQRELVKEKTKKKSTGMTDGGSEAAAMMKPEKKTGDKVKQ
jgi:hypothetical protein